MKWLFDIGNSRCKFALCRDGRMTARKDTARDLSGLRPWLAAHADGAESVWVASVAGAKTDKKLADMVASFGLRAYFIGAADADCGMKTAYRSEQLGIDRLVCLIAAWQRVKRSCIVADCGTATTVDYLDHRGEHRGGVIFSGLATAYAGLRRGTAALPRGGFGNALTVFATSTESAIESGCRYALIAGVKEAVQRMRAAADTDAPALLTGGCGEMVCAELGERAEYIRDLSLEGIAMLSEQRESRCRH